MRASHSWLTTLSGVDATPAEVAERLTSGGLEVESVERVGEGLDRVVVGEVRAKRKVEGKDKLSLVTVFDGEGEVEVICGAPNVPEPGGRILFARVGAVLPGGFEIGEREIAGVVSRGMICSETELGIGDGSAGIFVLTADEEGTPGQGVADALGLRDSIFEIGLTPNRPDGLGHVGLAREGLTGTWMMPEVERVLGNLERAADCSPGDKGQPQLQPPSRPQLAVQRSQPQYSPDHKRGVLREC